jgi:hypothetical protein
MRKTAWSLIVALVALVAIGAAPASAQGNQTFQQRWYYASDFGQWSVRGQQANTFQWSPGTVCNVSANGSATSFFAFNTNAPVLVVDATAANNEVLTPSAVTTTSSFCSITITPNNQHYSFSVTSGTGGLQEALNSISAVQAAPALVWLDRNWYALANQVPSATPASIIGAAKGGVSAILVDNTTAPFTNYVWAGTAYASGTWVNTVPAVAAGAAAGTSPTIAVAGAALSGTVSLTEGSAPTTGTLFTLTYATSAQFQYQPVCTVVNIGANTSPALTVTPTYGSSHALVTVSVAAAPTAALAYKFQFACH